MKNLNKKIELYIFAFIYLFLIIQAYLKSDSVIALISAICGITYTILAGKGIPICYPIGATGSVLYAYLSFVGHFWGNLVLYLCYYIPMQILGFFHWNKNLKQEKYEIVKKNLSGKEKLFLFLLTSIIAVFVIIILFYFGDKNPIIDGITTVFSILGMYLTVKRCIEQWEVWMGVNLLSFIMWLDVALKGGKVYSTVFMWFVYFILAIYFYKTWKNELSLEKR